MNLNIVPIEYDKRGLEEIVRIIHDAFPDFFDKFILKNPPDKSVYETFIMQLMRFVICEFNERKKY